MPIITAKKTRIPTSRPTPINTLEDGRVVVVEVAVSEPLNGAAAELPLAGPTKTVTVPVFITVTETKIITAPPGMNMVVERPSVDTRTSTIPSRPTGGPRQQAVVPSTSATSNPTTSSSTSLSSTSSTAVTNTSASTQGSTTSFTNPSTSSPIEIPSTGPVQPAEPSTALQDSKTKPLSSGAIVGITLSSVIFLLLLCICFIRYRSRRQRKKSRESWVSPFIEKKPIMIGPTSSGLTSSSTLSSGNPVTQKQTQTQSSSYRPVLPREEKQREFLGERWQRLRGLSLRRAFTNATSGGPGNLSTASQDGNRRNMKRKLRNGDGSYIDIESQPQTQIGRRPPGPPPNEPLPLPPSAEIYRQPSSSGRLLRVLRRPSQFPRNVKVTYDFDPIRDDELAVRMGDALRVVALYEDGWSRCENRLGQQGFVPVDCYQEYGSRERF